MEWTIFGFHVEHSTLKGNYAIAIILAGRPVVPILWNLTNTFVVWKMYNLCNKPYNELGPYLIYCSQTILFMCNLMHYAQEAVNTFYI